MTSSSALEMWSELLKCRAVVEGEFLARIDPPVRYDGHSVVTIHLNYLRNTIRVIFRMIDESRLSQKKSFQNSTLVTGNS